MYASYVLEFALCRTTTAILPSLFFGSSPKQRAPGRMYLFSWCQCQKLQAYRRQSTHTTTSPLSATSRWSAHTSEKYTQQTAPPFLALCSPIGAQDFFLDIHTLQLVAKVLTTSMLLDSIWLLLLGTCFFSFDVSFYIYAAYIGACMHVFTPEACIISFILFLWIRDWRSIWKRRSRYGLQKYLWSFFTLLIFPIYTDSSCRRKNSWYANLSGCFFVVSVGPVTATLVFYLNFWVVFYNSSS
jgi:hypothetical protein